ncbi:DUF58 domain-containing protein [Stratiformator vulcanicus]|uniref:DUF58 domain-containing protein n=1 Tax=Stratiformator vulcanicus TaxID=2527980 RepID=A0A517R0E3_9PLAN|nr:DUF58 domain-containing protein [Stratiformator vulcanicus]QDT37341.1 hypothetical protein Pan189_17140 [Stratiformator vulcanicus]
MPASTAQLSSLLTNATLTRLERLRLAPRKRLTNHSRGEHLAGRGGASTEFEDYRDYVAGDDMRRVDWNIFSRLNRPYVKLYRHEEEMHVVVIVDGSTSMSFEGKFQLARQLAASFGVMTLLGGERLSIYGCQAADKAPKVLPQCAGRVSMRRMLSFVEGLDAGGNAMIDRAVETVLRNHSGRGMAILLSDFLTWGELGRPLNRLFGAGLEVCAIQILGPNERNPQVDGDVRLIDSETGSTLDVTSAEDLVGMYHEHLAAMNERVAALCTKRNGRFLPVSSDEPIETLMFDTLRRRGWLR